MNTFIVGATATQFLLLIYLSQFTRPSVAATQKTVSAYSNFDYPTRTRTRTCG